MKLLIKKMDASLLYPINMLVKEECNTPTQRGTILDWFSLFQFNNQSTRYGYLREQPNNTNLNLKFTLLTFSSY